MNTETRLMTAAEFERLPDDHMRHELVRGEVRTMPPAGGEHGVLIINLSTPLAVHVKANKLGLVLGAETGFRIATDPDTVRAPDVHRLYPQGPYPGGRRPQSFLVRPSRSGGRNCFPGRHARRGEGESTRVVGGGNVPRLGRQPQAADRHRPPLRAGCHRPDRARRARRRRLVPDFRCPGG